MTETIKLVKQRFKRWLKIYLFFALPILILYLASAFNILLPEHINIGELVALVVLFFFGLPTVLLFHLDEVFLQDNYSNLTKLSILLVCVAFNFICLLFLTSYLKTLKRKKSKPLLT